MSKSLLWWLIGAVISPAAPAIADVVERDFHKSFGVSRGMRLDLHHGDGDGRIQIRAGDARVRVRGR